ncbi:MAG: dipeptidase [Thermoguttaceae bacterium]
MSHHNHFFVCFLSIVLSATPLVACTNVLVTRGASVDGSVMITYTADSAGFFGRLQTIPAAEYPEGATVVVPFDNFVPGKKSIPNRRAIPQVGKTFHVIAASGQGLMNEHQLVMAETTFGGRKELVDPRGSMNYETLMTLALQRTKTAREAIKLMTELAETYGYHDEGESISVGDTQEAWVLEIVGCGEDASNENGRVCWVAMRVPDGEIHCHANQARIRTFPKDDPENCFYSKNVETFAIRKGWYDPKSGEQFRFDLAYAPPDATSKRVCESRVWSVFRRSALSKNFSADYARGVADAEPYPWSIRPDKKLSLSDVMALMRDHYQDTPYDMTQGIDAGPYKLPRRWRPLTWKLKDENAVTETIDASEADEKNTRSFAWERPISTAQTAYSFVSQSRSWLPDAVGGCLWYGVDDTFLTCYFPVYCQNTKLPVAFTVDAQDEFSWQSAWWIFNLVSNYANLNFAAITPHIIETQRQLETEFIESRSAIETEAARADDASVFLTADTISCGDRVMTQWQRLAVEIFTTFNDGYIRRADPETGGYKYDGFSYPEPWLRRIATERGNDLQIPPK